MARAREAHGRRPADAEKLARATLAWREALAERDKVIVEALKAGASTHQVAAITGMAQSTIHSIGTRNGWPTPEQRAEWDAHQRDVDEWRTWLDGKLAQLDD